MLVAMILRRLYDWTVTLAGHRRAVPTLGVVSFLESWIFPVPPDAMLVPMVIARPDRAYLAASVCLAGSIAGGLVGYLIGALMFEQVALPLLTMLGQAGRFDEFAERYNEQGFLVVLMAGFTPFPYKVITILSGSTGLSLPLFLLSSLAGRGVRFFLIAMLLRRYGDGLRMFIERRLGLVTVLAGLALVALGVILGAG